MMRANFIVIAGICLGLVLLTTLVTGEIRRVPQNYSTIQAALDAVVDDDTVLVSLGMYAEQLMAPPRRFWLIGDVEVDTGDFERPVIDPSTLDSAQWRRCMTVSEGGEIMIERMAFRNRASMYPRSEADNWSGIAVSTDHPITLRYCAFDSIMGALVYQPPPYGPSPFRVEDCRFTHGLRRQVASGGQADVRRSVFLECRSPGFVSGYDSSRVEDCVFSGDSTYTCLWLLGDNLIVRNNVFGPIDTCTVRIMLMGGGNTGVMEGNVFHDIRIVSNEYLGLFNADTIPIRIRDNQFINIRANRGVLSLAHSSESPCGLLAEIDSNLFLNVVINWAGAAHKALSFFDYTLVRGNRFHELTPAAVACIYAVRPDSSPMSEFRCNNFQAGDYAIRSPWETQDARWDYWGDSSGPYNGVYNPHGLGARVDDSVRFDPWCPDTSCFLSVPGIGKPLPEKFVFDAYPNPFNSTLHLTLIPSEVKIIKVELFDLLGRKIKEIWHGPLAFQKDISFNASALASGIYFARVTDVIDRKTLATAKLVLLK
jgi:hypothetical protein